MKSHGSLFEQITSRANLDRALLLAARGKRHRPAVRRFVARARDELDFLRAEIQAGHYRPRPYRQFHILDPKPRLISCADFRDRVVHHAVCAVIAPCIERRLVAETYACRKALGCHRAVKEAQRQSRRFRWFLKTDIRRYYDSINHEILLRLTRRLFREEKVRDLVERIVRHPFPGQSAGLGLPIGNLTSQWLANLYLDAFDHWIKEVQRAPAYLRYMDDLVVWDHDRGRLWALLHEIMEWLGRERGLELKWERSVVAPTHAGMAFVGFRIYPGCLRRQRRRLRRTRRRLEKRESDYVAGRCSEADVVATARSVTSPYIYLKMKPPVASKLEM